MARPSAAAAGGFLLACAVLLMFAGQSSAETIPFPFAYLFHVGYVPPAPIVKINSKQNPGLNMAVRYGKVVLATDNTQDYAQLWWKVSPPTSFFDGEGAKYWLVNVATRQAMTCPPVNGPMQVQLAEFNPSNGAQLWVPTPPLQDGFYQIKPYSQDSKALNGLGGYVRDGTVIGIYSDTPVSSNTLWSTRNVYY